MKKYTHTVSDKTAEIEIIETENPPKMALLDKKKHLQDVKAEYFFVREAVSKMLDKASALLPQGYQFKVFETYRSTEKQIQLWNMQIEKEKKKHPNYSQLQIDQEANNVIANPYQIGSGHQTGGAVDITLCYNGVEVDMGTPYLSKDNIKIKTNTSGLTKQQKENRKLLVDVLSAVGMVNYPLEWCIIVMENKNGPY